jgi:hypothetical protein
MQRAMQLAGRSAERRLLAERGLYSRRQWHERHHHYVTILASHDVLKKIGNVVNT